MRRFTIKVVGLASQNEKAILSAVQVLNCCQGYYSFVLETGRWVASVDADLADGRLLDWCRCSKILEEYAHGVYVIYVTDLPFEDNWFSHEERTFSLLSTYSWEELYAPPRLSAYIAYQMIQAAVCFTAGLTEQMELRQVHEVATSCMFDLCETKPEIIAGMHAGCVCPQCRARLLEYGMDEDALVATDKMLDAVRSESLGRGVSSSALRCFVAMDFNDRESLRVYEKSMEPALRSLGIKCVCLKNHSRAAQILDGIEKSIRDCQLFLAIGNVANLNVYLEFGLAKGMGKTVNLIVDQSTLKSHRLPPTDLRNWNCITYNKGNYATLARNVREAFKQYVVETDDGDGVAGC